MKKLIVFAMIILASCMKEPTKPEPIPSPTMDGVWEGSGRKNNIDYKINARFTQIDTMVACTGSISALVVTINFTGVGKNIYPNVSFDFASADSTLKGSYVGKFDSTDANIINGLATVPAFQIVNEPLKIVRIGQ